MQSEKLARTFAFCMPREACTALKTTICCFTEPCRWIENGEFARVEYGGETFSGRAWNGQMRTHGAPGLFRARGQRCAPPRAGFSITIVVWPAVAIFGRDRMASFEICSWTANFPNGKTLIMHTSKTRMRLWRAAPRGESSRSLGSDFETGHIVNGHIPVRAASGEQPVKAGGKLIVIDGGFCKAYHQRTGIAGYTLVSSSRGLSLRSHGPLKAPRRRFWTIWTSCLPRTCSSPAANASM